MARGNVKCKVKMCLSKSSLLFLLVILNNLISISFCRRLSLRESLTAFAEEDSSEVSHLHKENDSTIPQHHLYTTSTTVPPYSGSAFSSYRSGAPINSYKDLLEKGNGKFSLILTELSKDVVPPPPPRRPHYTTESVSERSTSAINSPSIPINGTNDGVYYRDSEKKKITTSSTKEAWTNFLTTVKNEFEDIKGKWQNKSWNSSNNISKPFEEVHDDRSRMKAAESNEQSEMEPSPPRNKKEVGHTSGLRDLLWHTTTALWSVNKVHLLPTFLHTKTGGKLSLIRDSIFKPIAILSQFKHGVHQINNEKLNSLSRLATGGWTSPKSQVVVVKVPHHHHRYWTIARYLLRLTRHTVVTKWRLKRALLGLQMRACRQLWRILSSNNLQQKIATFRILTNAIVRGKLSILRLIAGLGGKNMTMSMADMGMDMMGMSPYPGKDNSQNVDITYSSLGGGSSSSSGNGNTWSSMSYEPPSMDFQPMMDPSPNFSPPKPPATPPSKINYYHYEVPHLPKVTSRSPPSPPPPKEELIGSPSYANLLELMGIDPSSYDYKEDKNNMTEAQQHRNKYATSPFTSPMPSSSSSAMPPSPNPTISYYSSTTSLREATASPPPNMNGPAGSFMNRPAEKPAASSYHFHFRNYNDLDTSQSAPASSSLKSYLSNIPKLDGSYDPYRIRNFRGVSTTTPVSITTASTTTTSTTTLSPFRLKLLGNMMVTPLTSR